MSDISDKNNAMAEYLMSLPYIKEHPLYFNFGEIEDGSKQLIAQSMDISINKHYVDGGEGRRYTVTLVDFKSIGYNALVQGKDNENISDILETQQIIDWVTEQNEKMNYPDFGDKCEVEKIYATTNTPHLENVDTSTNPAIAEYTVTIVVEYIDNTKVIWNT